MFVSNKQMREGDDLCVSVEILFRLQWKNWFLDLVCAVSFSPF
jgi:hypothetical protein